MVRWWCWDGLDLFFDRLWEAIVGILRIRRNDTRRNRKGKRVDMLRV